MGPTKYHIKGHSQGPFLDSTVEELDLLRDDFHSWLLNFTMIFSFWIFSAVAKKLSSNKIKQYIFRIENIGTADVYLTVGI